MGIRPDMTVAEAKALAADLVCHPVNPEADLAALLLLAECCDTFTPTFGPEDGECPESLLMDVTGCTHLFSDLETMLSAVARVFADKGFVVRIGMAPTIGAAWAAAHALAGQDHPMVLTEPEELDQLPSAALRISSSLTETLTELGLHTVGQLRRIPRATLPSRFGKELLQRLDQLSGLLPEAVTPLHPCVPVSAVWTSEEPFCGRESLRFLCRQLLEQLLSELKPKRQGIRELLFQMRGMSGLLCEQIVRLISPCDSLKHLAELLDLQLDKADLPEDFLFLKLETMTVESLRIRQRDLFGHDISQTEQDEVHILLNRITSRLGLSSVVRARLIAEVQPELSVVHDPLVSEKSVDKSVSGKPTTKKAMAGKATAGKSFERKTAERKTAASQPAESSVPLRPLRLFSQQQPIRMEQTGPEGGPVSFQWQHQKHRVIRSWGPERIETGWWRGPAVRRDYYGVETQAGCQLWLFCDLDQAAWFVHGAFD